MIRCGEKKDGGTETKGQKILVYMFVTMCVCRNDAQIKVKTSTCKKVKVKHF